MLSLHPPTHARWLYCTLTPAASFTPSLHSPPHHPLQVSFQLLIPCMLFSKVASTLAANPDPVLLAGIAAAAVLQILAGAACGLLLAPLLGLGPDQLDPQQRGSSWRGRSSPAAASAIALSLAAASGAPQAAVALRPKQPPPPAGALWGAA